MSSFQRCLPLLKQRIKRADKALKYYNIKSQAVPCKILINVLQKGKYMDSKKLREYIVLAGIDVYK